MISLLHDICMDYTLRTIIIGTALFGITSAIIGSFAFMQKQSLLGDVISHATLPGIVLAFFFTQSKQPIVLLMGGALSAILGTSLMYVIIQKTTLKKDAALGIILSVFFGFGLVLLTWVQQFPNAQHGMLIKYIFGNASTLMQHDLHVIGFVCLLICTTIALLWKECKLVVFDAAYAQCIGYPVLTIQCILIFLTIICIIVGLQLVGVILMSSFLIAPSAAARQWTTKFGSMVLLAMFFGFFSSVSGALISAQYEQLPTGPVIVVVASIIVFISLMCAPKRGVYKKIKRQRTINRHIPECPLEQKS
ncbi:MAG: metal ABC transporter permease [Candidatus Dependentiae bacterium]